MGRKLTAMAFQTLADLVKHQRSNRAYLAISSFLEWGQVLSLMIGQYVAESKEMYRSVNLLYDYHKTQWTYQEQTSSALNLVGYPGATTMQNIQRTMMTNFII
jgi:hypothetical protein